MKKDLGWFFLALLILVGAFQWEDWRGLRAIALKHVGVTRGIELGNIQIVMTGDWYVMYESEGVVNQVAVVAPVRAVAVEKFTGLGFRGGNSLFFLPYNATPGSRCSRADFPPTFREVWKFPWGEAYVSPVGRSAILLPDCIWVRVNSSTDGNTLRSGLADIKLIVRDRAQ